MQLGSAEAFLFTFCRAMEILPCCWAKVLVTDWLFLLCCHPRSLCPNGFLLFPSWTLVFFLRHSPWDAAIFICCFGSSLWRRRWTLSTSIQPSWKLLKGNCTAVYAYIKKIRIPNNEFNAIPQGARKKEKLSLVFVKERNNKDQRRNKWMRL